MKLPIAQEVQGLSSAPLIEEAAQRSELQIEDLSHLPALVLIHDVPFLLDVMP